MSIKAMLWAFDADVKPSGAKFVLVALANFADETGSCYPGQHTLAKMTGQSVDSVQRHLVKLELAGFISRKHQARQDGRGRTSDRYTLHLSGDSTPQSAAKNVGASRPQSAATKAAICGDQGRNLRGEGTLREPLERTPTSLAALPLEGVEPVEPRRRNGHALPQGFEEWWIAYPRKEARPAAVKAYAKAVARVESPVVLMAGLTRWTTYWREAKKERSFIPHPTTWLNQDRWNDTPPPVPAANGHQNGYYDESSWLTR